MLAGMTLNDWAVMLRQTFAICMRDLSGRWMQEITQVQRSRLFSVGSGGSVVLGDSKADILLFSTVS